MGAMPRAVLVTPISVTLLAARPQQPEVAVVFNPLVPLLGGGRLFVEARAG